MSIKNILRSNETLYFFYKQLNININKRRIKRSAQEFTCNLFQKYMDYPLNLDNPVTFNEKIQWLKFNRMDDNYIRCADKFELRNYVTENYPEYSVFFPNLIKVFKKSNDIHLDDLPEKFVLKCNHGCGFNYICTDKKNVDLKHLKKTVSRWMRTDYEYVACEMQYHFMKKIIYVEEFINSFTSEVPIDYKFYCFNGNVEIIMVCLDRKGDHASEYHYFDKEWLPVELDKNTNLEKSRQIKKPINYEKMFEIAQNLSKPFEYVRIDFFDTDTKPIIGEMTFTPSGGIDSDYDYETDKKLGAMIKL